MYAALCVLRQVRSADKGGTVGSPRKKHAAECLFNMPARENDVAELYNYNRTTMKPMCMCG